MHSARPFLPAAAAFAGALAFLAGCASGDYLRAAQSAFERSLRVESPGAFLAPVLARVRGEPVPAPSPQARQHYLEALAQLEVLTPRGREELRQQGLLGDALALKAIAQWRLGRLEAAHTSAVEARESRQEPVAARDRALLAAFEGVLPLEAAIDAAAAGKPFDEIRELVRGDNGAWRLLGVARGEVPAGDPLRAGVLEARLAAFKILKDARDRAGQTSTPNQPTAADEAWARARAEAQVELAEFASAPAGEPAAHAARVRQWQILCGLDAPLAR